MSYNNSNNWSVSNRGGAHQDTGSREQTVSDTRYTGPSGDSGRNYNTSTQYTRVYEQPGQTTVVTHKSYQTTNTQSGDGGRGFQQQSVVERHSAQYTDSGVREWTKSKVYNAGTHSNK